jgi:cytochrome bd-type quinol oxidase subunit 2
MLKNLSKKIATIAASLSLALLPALIPVTVRAAEVDIRGNLCSGTSLDTSGAADCNGDGAADAQNLVTNIINIFSLVVGIVAVIMIIVGGFKYITSNGDSGSISSAKTTIMYAIIGLVVVAFAQLIVQFVLDKVTSAE